MNAHSTMRRAAPRDDAACSSAAALLSNLRAAFKMVEECLAGLELQSAGPGPDMAGLGLARLRMSQARHSKRQLVYRACQLVLADATGPEIQALRGIERANAEYFKSSTEHVRYWTPAALRSDWPGFCQQSRTMRLRMKHLAALEQRVLLPMLAALGQCEPEATASPCA